MLELLRHGDTGRSGFRGSSDDPLSARGWAQMEQATQEVRWQAVVSSSLRRCADFAGAFATRHRLPLTIDPRWAELDFGDWEGRDAAGLLLTEPEALERFWSDPWENPPPAGEAMQAFELRVLAALRDACARAQADRVLVITHAGVIRLLLCLHRGSPRSGLLSLPVAHASIHALPGAASLVPMARPES
jgi:broad specificity phosphatase PhoE